MSDESLAKSRQTAECADVRFLLLCLQTEQCHGINRALCQAVRIFIPSDLQACAAPHTAFGQQSFLLLSLAINVRLRHAMQTPDVLYGITT
jgi:hypothetical protein